MTTPAITEAYSVVHGMHEPLETVKRFIVALRMLALPISDGNDWEDPGGALDQIAFEMRRYLDMVEEQRRRAQNLLHSLAHPEMAAKLAAAKPVEA